MTRARTTGGTRTAVGALVCAVVVALSGCTADSDGDGVAAEPPLFQELAVPDDAVPGAVQVGDISVLAGKDTLPVLVAGTRTEARKPARLAVWSAAPGAKIVDEATFLEVEGTPQAVDLDGSTELTAVAGYSWAGSAYLPYVLTSKDRARWDAVEIPDELADMRPALVAVDRRTAYVVGTDGSERVVGMRVVDGVAERLDLPDVEGATSATGLDAASGTVVLVASPPAGAEGGPVVLTSRDDARTWERKSLGRDATVADVVVQRSGTTVILGSTYDDAEHDTWWITAWSSADGARWRRDDRGSHLVDGPPEQRDNWFGGATEVGDRVVAPVTMESNTQMALINRSADGLWDGPIDRSELRSDGSSVDAGQLTPTAQVSAVPGGVAVSVVHGDGAAQFFGSDMRPLGSLGKVSPWFALRASQDSRDGSPVQASRMVFTDDGDGWHEGPESTWYTVEGDTLVAAPDEDLPTDRTLSAASDPSSGKEAALFHGWDERRNTFTIDPWSRERNGIWTKGTGFDDGYATVAGIVHTGDRWVAAGAHATSADTDDVRQAAAWTSRDGARWKRAGTLEPGAQGSEVDDVCILPSGDVLAVGSLDIGARDTPVTWTLEGDRWVRRTVEVTGDGSSSGQRCVATGDTVSVFVDADRRTQVFDTSDGSSYEATWASEPGNSVGETVLWDDTLVAAAWMDDERHTGPALRVSEDGESWDWVPIPSRSASGVEIERHGDGLVVSTSDAGGVQAWQVGSLEQLLEEAVAAR